MRQAFNALDADGSGLLDRHEIRALLESLGKRPTEVDIDEAMAELDADKNGEVNFEEFSGMYAAQQRRCWCSFLVADLRAFLQRTGRPTFAQMVMAAAEWIDYRRNLSQKWTPWSSK